MSNCLIIAAGMGARMGPESSKPLLELDGTPLIEHVIRNNLEAGIRSFYVVSGYRGEELRAFLDQLCVTLDITVQHVINEDYRRGNGLSVTAAAEVLREDFILTMCDHLYEPSVVSDLLATGAMNQGLTLAVDSSLDNPEIDLDDVTRVFQHDGHIVHIAKGLQQFNCFDIGVFYCTPALFDAIAQSLDATGDESLSGGVRLLAAQGRAGVMDIGERYWCDVDNRDELEKVRKLYATRAR